MPTTSTWLEYHLPMLGTVKARLFPLAANCYELLTNHNHIKRLERMDQLGVIRHIYQGAHHSRWEYVMSQLALIYKLASLRRDTDGARVAQSVGLSSNTDFNDHNGGRASGADVMQCWALLLNSGHLHGTFSTEAGLLRILHDDNNLKNAFLSTYSTPDNQAHDYCNRIIVEKQIYNIHKAIAFFFLYRYHRDPNKELVKTLLDVLKWGCIPTDNPTGKQETLVRVFNRVRQLCFLSLDSLYAPTPIRLDLGSIFLNLQDRADDICLANETPLCRQLDGLNELMEREIYSSPLVLLHHETHAEHMKKHIAEFYEQEGVNTHEISDMRKLLVSLQEDDIKSNVKEYERTIHLRFVPKFPYQLSMTHEELVQTLQDQCGRMHVDVSAMPDARNEGVNLTIGQIKGITTSLKIRCFRGLINTMVNIADNIIALPDTAVSHMFLDWHAKCPICIDWSIEVIQKLLETITSEDLQFRINKHHEFVACTGRGSTSNATNIRTLSEAIPDPGRKHEVDTHARALETITARGRVLSCISAIDVTKQNGIAVTNIDGLSVIATSNSLSLLVVEAKNMVSGATATARKQLATRLSDMGLTDVLDDPTVHPITDGAYVFSKIKTV